MALNASNESRHHLIISFKAAAAYKSLFPKQDKIADLWIRFKMFSFDKHGIDSNYWSFLQITLLYKRLQLRRKQGLNFSYGLYSDIHCAIETGTPIWPTGNSVTSRENDLFEKSHIRHHCRGLYNINQIAISPGSRQQKKKKINKWKIKKITT